MTSVTSATPAVLNRTIAWLAIVWSLSVTFRFENIPENGLRRVEGEVVAPILPVRVAVRFITIAWARELIGAGTVKALVQPFQSRCLLEPRVEKADGCDRNEQPRRRCAAARTGHVAGDVDQQVGAFVREQAESRGRH